MELPDHGPVTVFGGTGYLGWRIAERLARGGTTVRVASRDASRRPIPDDVADRITPFSVDVRNHAQVRAALSGAQAAVNAVSLYAETRRLTFDEIHVEAAGGIAAEAARQGLSRLVHVSGLGADHQSSSDYIRARGRGDMIVRATAPRATILRPGPLFDRQGGLLETLLRLVWRLPVIPLFGSGTVRLQPVHADDVAGAVAAVLEKGGPAAAIEIGGPQVFRYRDLLRTVASAMVLRRTLVPVPYTAWRIAAGAMSGLANPPLTPAQVELMERDCIVTGDAPTLQGLGIRPQFFTDVLARRLGRQARPSVTDREEACETQEQDHESRA